MTALIDTWVIDTLSMTSTKNPKKAEELLSEALCSKKYPNGPLVPCLLPVRGFSEFWKGSSVGYATLTFLFRNPENGLTQHFPLSPGLCDCRSCNRQSTRNMFVQVHTGINFHFLMLWRGWRLNDCLVNGVFCSITPAKFPALQMPMGGKRKGRKELL